MSKSLISLIEYSLIPAALLIIGKLAGIFVAIRLYNVPLNTKEYANQLFAPVGVSNFSDLALITSFSDIIMYVSVATYFSLILVRAIYFHDSHAKPTLVAKLATHNLLKLIQTSYQIYHQAFISIVFVLIANALIILNVIQNTSYVWIAIVSGIFTLGLIFGLLFDVYREVKEIQRSPGKYEWI